MSKSRVCIEKTASLAKQGLPKSQKILVHEKTPKECIPPTYTPSVSRPQPKRIKVCTGVEMKKVCPTPPPPPICPPKPLTLSQRLARLMLFGMKGLVAAALIYVTSDLGVWGDSKASRELYETIMCDIADIFDKDAAKVEPIPPSCRGYFQAAFGDPTCEEVLIANREKRMAGLKQRWNKLVITASSKMAKIVTGEVDDHSYAICEEEQEADKQE